MCRLGHKNSLEDFVAEVHHDSSPIHRCLSYFQCKEEVESTWNRTTARIPKVQRTGVREIVRKERETS
jgi:hypothetical protein